MARKKRLTPNQKEFYKQIKRLQRYEHQIMKQGGILLQEFGKTPLPKRVTKKYLAKLKSIKPTTLKKQAQIEVGNEIWDYYEWEKKGKPKFDGYEGKQPIRTKEMYEAAIENMYDQFLQLPNGIATALGSWLMSLVFEHGAYKIGNALLSAPIDVVAVMQSVGYDYHQAIILMETTIFNNLPQDQREEAEEEWEQSDATWGEI